MPNYWFKCKDCLSEFKKVYPDRDAFVADDPACPKCKGRRVRTTISMPSVPPSVQNGINRCNTYPYISRRLPHKMAEAPHDKLGHTVVLNKREEDRLARIYGGADTPMVRE